LIWVDLEVWEILRGGLRMNIMMGGEVDKNGNIERGIITIMLQSGEKRSLQNFVRKNKNSSRWIFCGLLTYI